MPKVKYVSDHLVALIKPKGNSTVFCHLHNPTKININQNNILQIMSYTSLLDKYCDAHYSHDHSMRFKAGKCSRPCLLLFHNAGFASRRSPRAALHSAITKAVSTRGGGRTSRAFYPRDEINELLCPECQRDFILLHNSSRDDALQISHSSDINLEECHIKK